MSPAREPTVCRQVSRPAAPVPSPSERGGPGASGSGWFAVRVLDNPVNTYEEVITVCVRVLGVSPEQGYQIAYEVDHEGSCVVGRWPRPEAERVAAGIAVIGIEVRLEPSVS